jgi:hypothetical protein
MTLLDIILLGTGFLLLVVAALSVTAAWRGEGRLRAIQDTPTSTAHDVTSIHRTNGAYGQACELIGVAECDASLNGPLSGQSCIAYSHSLAWEEWGKPALYGRHANTESLVYRNGGNEFDDRRVALFWVRDATGRVRVDPSNAELDLNEIDQRYEVTTSSFGDSERRTRREEKALPLGEQVYVLGYLAERKGEPVIQRHPSDPSKKFIISYRSEQELAGVSSSKTSIYYFVAGISGSLGLVLMLWRLLRRGA